MQNTKSEIVVPVLLIAVGAGWLLSSYDIVPEVKWFWPLGLAAAGVLMLVVQGLNRVSLVLGPFLILGAALSALRQAGKISWEQEMPILLIGLGLLMIISKVSGLPNGVESDQN